MCCNSTSNVNDCEIDQINVLVMNMKLSCFVELFEGFFV
jgi:hypothetical protein